MWKNSLRKYRNIYDIAIYVEKAAFEGIVQGQAKHINGSVLRLVPYPLATPT